MNGAGRRPPGRRPAGPGVAPLTALAAVLSAVLVLVLAGCAAPGSAGSTAPTPRSSGAAAAHGPSASGPLAGKPSTPGPGAALSRRLAGRSFESTSATGHRLVAGSTIRIRFADGGHVGWQAGCNSMGGRAHWDGAMLTVDEVMSTEMGCAAALMEQDQWLSGLLRSGVRASLDGDVLTVTGGTATLRLTDSRVANPDLPLQGTTWVLDGIVSGSGPSGSVSSVPQGIYATMRIAGGRIHLFDGLNDYDGPVDPGTLSIGSDTVTIHGQIAGSGVGCAGGATCSVDLSVLTTPFHYTIRGDHLTVSGIGSTAGKGLTFVAGKGAAASASSGFVPTMTTAPHETGGGTSPGATPPRKSPPIVAPGSMTPLPPGTGPTLSGRHDSIPPQPPPH